MSEQVFANELNQQKGMIFAPGSQWLAPREQQVSGWDGDIWCDPKEEIERPEYEQGLARFIESVVAAGYCGDSGSARFNFVHQHVTDRATGDLFDWTQRFIDREFTPQNPEDEVTICDTFGIAARRTMMHLKERVDNPRKTLLQRRNLWRICYLSLARKCFLARIGYPEFCTRQVF